MRKAFLALFFILLFSNAFAWYNDLGNDSCIVSYADSEIYYLHGDETSIVPTFKIENNCGKQLLVDVGALFDSKIASHVSLNWIKINSIDSNWWNSKQAITLAEDSGADVLPFQNFETKARVKGVTLPVGTYYLKASFEVPKTGKKEEFALTIQDQVDSNAKSVLDPWFDESAEVDRLFYESCASGNIAANGWQGDTTDYDDSSNYFNNTYAAQKGMYQPDADWNGVTDFNFFVKLKSASGAIGVTIFQIDEVKLNPTTGYKVTITTSNSIQLVNKQGGAIIISASPTINAGTWYDVNLNRVDGIFTLWLDNALQGTASWVDNNFDDSSAVSIDAQTSNNSIDEISLYEPATAADVNIASVDSYPVEQPFPVFAYENDGNLTIDFNVFSKDNLRMTIDLTFDSSLIVNDLNLSSDICDDINFETPRTCSWDWNIHRTLVPDGNYLLSAEITLSDSKTATNTLTNSLRIGNDVNVLVKIPKDEATNTVLDLVSEYKYNVKVLDDTNQTNFTNLTEDLYLNLRKETASPIILTVDTNDDTAYLSRNYYLSFTTESDYTLQPYLVPVTSGVSTKISTQDIIDYSPISDVTINIYANVTETGRTLIETVVTDSKGEAFVSGVANENYDYEVYYKGEQINTFDITVTSTVITILFKRTTYTPIETYPTITVLFNPAFTKLLSGQTNLQQTVSVTNGQIQLVSVYATEINDNNRSLDTNRYSVVSAADSNTAHTNIITISTDLSAWDTNRPILITVDVYSGGKWFQYQTTYNGYQATQIASQMLEILKVDFAIDLGCDSTSNCGPLAAIAIIISLIGAASFAMFSPIQNTLGTTIIGIILLSFFAFLGWVPFYWFFLATLIAVVAVIVEWRR